MRRELDIKPDISDNDLFSLPFFICSNFTEELVGTKMKVGRGSSNLYSPFTSEDTNEVSWKDIISR